VQQSDRYQVEADIDWQAGPAGSVENDSERKSHAKNVGAGNVCGFRGITLGGSI